MRYNVECAVKRLLLFGHSNWNVLARPLQGHCTALEKLLLFGQYLRRPCKAVARTMLINPNNCLLWHELVSMYLFTYILLTI